MFRRWIGQWRTLRQRFNMLCDNAKLNGDRIDHLSWQIDQLARENRMLLGYLSLPKNELWREKLEASQGEPADNAFPNSTLCRQESFEQPYFAYWARELNIGLSYHRKVWEHVFICQALWQRGAIRPDAKALGFGVGREPLAAYFAGKQVNIVATDLAGEDAAALGWSATDQHAANISSLWYPGVCSRADFDQRVSFRVCDMNQIPEDLCEFDFCWSACSLEHLGSIDHGLRFIESSLECLKPGGWAIHTTEFNMSSNTHTISEGGTVLYRQRDLEELADRLKAQGHAIAPLDLNPGLAPLDRYIDVAPFRNEPHLKLALEGYATTSIGLIIQKDGLQKTH